MFVGFVDLGDDKLLQVMTLDANGTPSAPASAPTYEIWASDLSAKMTNGDGTMSLVTSGTTGWYKAEHSILEADGYAAGSEYVVKIDFTVGSTARSVAQSFQVV